MSNGPQSSGWLFTSYLVERRDRLRSDLPDTIRYLIFQLERCPTTNRLHIQGYVEFKRSWRRVGVARILDLPDAHLEVRRGTRNQARDYCRKSDTREEGPWELGTWNAAGSGNRSDLESVRDAIREGLPEVDLADQFFESWVRYRSSFNAYRELRVNVPNVRQMETRVLWGPSGTGKTFRATKFGGESYWILTRPAARHMPLWFDGYSGQECLIIDEFYGWIPFDFLLRLLDVYRLQLQVRGGFVWAQYRNVVITSNADPSEWYPGVPEDRRAALLRRLTYITRVEATNQDIPEMDRQDDSDYDTEVEIMPNELVTQ